MSSLQEFWEIINKDYPDIVDSIIDYSEKEVDIKWDYDFNKNYTGESNQMSSIFSYPPILPISSHSTTFNSEEGAFYTKLKLI